MRRLRSPACPKNPQNMMIFRLKYMKKKKTQTWLSVNEVNTLTSQEEKQKIINQYHHSDEDFVNIQINDRLTIDNWGDTPALETIIPVNFEDL